MEEGTLSVREEAAHLGRNPEAILKGIGQKKTPAHRAGRHAPFVAGGQGRDTGQGQKEHSGIPY